MRPVADVKTSERCPTCHGTGEVKASILFTDSIEAGIRGVTEGKLLKRITIMLHPIIEAYVKQGWWNSILKNWQRDYGLKIHLESNSSMEILEFHLYNDQGEELDIPGSSED